MACSELDVLQFVEENDVKFIRLSFCDITGVQKNVSIMANELPQAFAKGISFDAKSIKGFANAEKSDLFLYPDPATLFVLPWRPSHGRVVRMFCDIKQPDNQAYEGDGRNLLKNVMAEAQKQGYHCEIGSKCEFYLFQKDDQDQPTLIPQDRGGYCDIAPLDKGENVRREVCLSLEEMGIYPESSHHEQGPGQNEIVFRHSSILTAADNFLTFKSVVKSIAERNGLYASFLPKPLANQSGSGHHINLSLHKDGINLFGEEERGGCLTEAAKHFMAGILARIREITAFLNPLTNSYERFGSFEAPRYLTWSYCNRSRLIRIPTVKGSSGRMEIRSADGACNPHLTFALLLQAGMDGILEKRPLCPPLAEDSCREPVEQLPATLEEALDLVQESAFVRRVVPESILQAYIEVKRMEWKQYQNAADKRRFEEEYYFPVV